MIELRKWSFTSELHLEGMHFNYLYGAVKSLLVMFMYFQQWDLSSYFLENCS